MAENFLMRYFREKNKYSKEAVADALQITEDQYEDMESGKTFLTFKAAEQLEAFYKTDTSYFYILGLQNQLIDTQEELIEMFKNKEAGKEQSVSEEDIEEEPDNAKESEEQLLDIVAQNPTYVIRQIFKDRDIDGTRDDLWDWLKSAISNNKSNCEDEGVRFELMTFYENLLPPLEALYLINEKTKPEDAKPLLPPAILALQQQLNQPHHLFDEQLTHPEKVLAPFFEKYTLKETRLLIKYWLDAGISSEGCGYDKGIQRSLLLLLSEHIQCLVEAAYYLNANPYNNHI